MRSLLAVAAAVLVYAGGLMALTGSPLWDPGVVDREAAELFGGAAAPACTTTNRDAWCRGTNCPPLLCYGDWGTGGSVQVLASGGSVFCAGQSSPTCRFVFVPFPGCPTSTKAAPAE